MKNICFLFSFIISFSVFAQKISQLENYVLKDYKITEKPDKLPIHTVLKKTSIVFRIKDYEGGVRVWVGKKCVLNKKKLKEKSAYRFPFFWVKIKNYFFFRKKIKKIKNKQITVLNLSSGEYIQFNMPSTSYRILSIDLMYSKKQKKYYWHLRYQNSRIEIRIPPKKK